MEEAVQEQQPLTTAANRYSQLTSDREHFIVRGDRCASLTIPTLFRRDVTSVANMKIKDPNQSMGARGVNTLASKLILSLLPINTPFFKLNLDEIVPDIDDELMEEVQKGLGVIERQTIRDVENSGDITVVFEALKHLLVVGNSLLFVGEDGTRMYDLNKFVTVRSPNGEWTEIVICEDVSPTSLDSDTLEQLKKADADAGSPDKTLKMYTHIKRENGRVKWHQEISDMVIQGTEADVPEDGNPWIPLRFLYVDGESYGRSYIEMFLGDLENLEVLTKAVTDGAKAAAKILFLVNPNGTTRARTIAQAPNLSVRSGNANDVTVLRTDKASDMRVAHEMITNIERRLAFAFMINAEVLRDAERVTAEEVRYVAQELDDSLGGVYSMLSQEFQLPYVRRRLFLLTKLKNVPKLPKEVKPAIVTGFAALGRGHDAEKLMRFVEKVAALLSNPSIAQKLNVDEMITRLAIADGIDINGLLVSQEDQAKGQEQAMGMQMLDKLGPEVIRQMGPAMMNQQTEGAVNGQEVPQPQAQQ
jgi:hypothetical protein